MKKFNINQFNPCLDAAKYYDACKSSEEAWNNCSRGDWMLWIALKLGVDIKILTLAKVHCALTIKHLIKDKRSINALEVALKFTNNKATLKELKISADDAHIAAVYAGDDVVTNTAAVYAADAVSVDYIIANATHATNAIYAAANAAYIAANTAAYAAADVAAYAAAYANYTIHGAVYNSANDAKIRNQLETANVCRKYLTKSVFKIINKLKC